ncbi:MAG: outer membrane lipoprotein-sorting protein [Pseudomonadota bacterium]
MISRTSLLLIVSFAFMPRMVLADPKGEEVMKKLDAAQVRAEDQIILFEMVVNDPSGKSRRVTMKVHNKGERRLVEFLAPGDVKGMKVLTLFRENMYVYLPAYRKIRRIANHARDQTIIGSDYTYDDMATATYGGLYTTKFLSEDKDHWKILATLKPGKTAPYEKIQFTINKGKKYPTELLFYNKKGAHVKTETRVNYDCKGEVCVAKIMKMVDHTRNNHWTTIELQNWEVNTGYSENVFSLRNLARGR